MSTRRITTADVEDDSFPRASLGAEIIAETADGWGDLIQALELIRSKPSADKVSPFNCEHDELFVMVDPEDFTPVEIAQLREWGFNDYGDGCLSSFRYGSA